MKLTLRRTHKTAQLDAKDQAVVTWHAELYDDAQAVQLMVATTDKDFAARCVPGASLELDLEALTAPPAETPETTQT
jgi:hypothetical protein